MRTVILNTLATLRAGHPIRGRITPDPTGDALVVQMSNLDPETGVDWDGVTRVSLPGRRAVFLQDGDILFVARGGRLFAALVEDAPGDAVAAPQLFVIRVRGRDVLPGYLAWYLNSRRGQQYLYQRAAGTSILHASRKVLEDLPVVLPGLERQALIVVTYRCWLREKALRLRLLAARERLIEAVLASSVGRDA